MSKNVLVVGAAGRVGLPMSITLANAGYTVYGLDTNKEANTEIMAGRMPFIEQNGEEHLRFALNEGRLTMYERMEMLTHIDYIVITLGTPVDDHSNPRLDGLMNFILENFSYLKKGVVIILRSTVAPGTTELVRKTIERKNAWSNFAPLKEGEDFHLVFAPERIAQGYALTEIKTLPQLIGAFNDVGYEKAKAFFDTFLEAPTIQLTPREAEFGKLITNMYRYVNFAFSNEVYQLASKQGVDAHKVINAANFNYKRMNMPLPGPNVGGPCLYKDGKFLVTDEPFADLIQVSFQINESMPQFIYNRMKQLNPNMGNVWILGKAFKRENDDTRNSLSFKMKKILERNGNPYAMIDPIVDPRTYNLYMIQNPIMRQAVDAVVIMTNHDIFKSTYEILKRDCGDNTIIADPWKMLDDSKKFHDGIFQLKDMR